VRLFASAHALRLCCSAQRGEDQLPHSQGNLYVRDALRYPEEDSSLVNVIQLGSPASTMPPLKSNVRISVEGDTVALLAGITDSTFPCDANDR